MTLRKAVFQIHWLLGITIGTVLAIMGVTGAIMAFEDQIIAALSPGVVQTAPRAAPSLTPDQLLARFAAQRPKAALTSLTLQSRPGASPQVTFVTGAKAGAQKLYLDRYDGRILGHATGEAFFATVRKLHRFLLLPGDGKGWGRQITGAAAFSLIFFVASGLYMRWPKRPQGVKYWLKPNLSAKRRGLYWSLHSVIGTWVAAVYLVIALTGLTFSYEWYKTGFTRVLGGTVTTDDVPAGAGLPKGGGRKATTPVALDTAWRTVLRERGGARTVVLSVPKTPATPIRIRALAVDAPNERAYDELHIDSRTGAVVERTDYADMAFGDRILAARLAVHRGSYFGLAGMILFMLAALTMPFFPVTGWLLYLGRRRVRRQRGVASDSGHASLRH